MINTNLDDINRKIYKSEIGKNDQEYLDKLRKEFFNYTATSSHCPLSWSKEVYFFLKEIEEKYGFVYEYYNEKILNERAFDNSFQLSIHVFQSLVLFPLLIKLRLKEVSQVGLHESKKPEDIDFNNSSEKEIKTYKLKLERHLSLKKNKEEKVIERRKKSYSIAWKLFFKEFPKFKKNVLTRMKYKTPVELGQFKEKFGSVTFYPRIKTKNEELRDEIRDDINNFLVELEIDLSLKGAYFDIENLSSEKHKKALSKRKKEENRKRFLGSL